jgi:hypothetical protein
LCPIAALIQGQTCRRATTNTNSQAEKQVLLPMRFLLAKRKDIHVIRFVYNTENHAREFAGRCQRQSEATLLACQKNSG